MRDQTIMGIIHGDTVALDRSPGLADGQKVRVTLRPASQADSEQSIRLSAGGWADADQAEFDSWLAETHRLRHLERGDSSS